MDSERELRWTVALEASLFFSVPCWSLAVDRAWPGDEPPKFIFALLIGASMATLLCHLTPAICEPTMQSFLSSRAGRLLQWPIGAWFCVGAMASLFQLANLTSGLFLLWRNAPQLDQPVWRSVGTALAVTCVVMSLGMAAKRRWNRRLAALSITVGVCLSLAGLVEQSSGLYTKHRNMTTEAGLGDPSSVAEGMLMSATPAVILAFRIGQMRMSRRGVVWTGFLGVWLPLIASTALVSLAKMCGARLYWKPSLPIEIEYAFAWIFQVTDRLQVLLWPLAVTVLAPCIVCAVWIVDFIRVVPWCWPRLAVLGAITVAAYAVVSNFAWALYYQYWLWSIVIACLLLGLAHLAASLKPTAISTKLR